MLKCVRGKDVEVIMTLEKRIQMADRLTPVEAEIGYYILQNMEKVSQSAILELSENIHVSKSAVHRFCKKIGLKGFNELKIEIVRELANEVDDMETIDVNYPFKQEDGPKMIADKLLKLYENAIADTYSYIDPIELQKIARLLHNAKAIDIYTHAHNMNVAENFKDKMLTIGRVVNCPKSFYEQRFTALASEKGHVAIILSYSGKATFVNPILKALYQKRIPTILIGKAGSNIYPHYISHALCISGKENLRDRISQFSSHIAMQYMLDVVFGCIYNMNRDKNIAYLKNAIDFMDDRNIQDD